MDSRKCHRLSFAPNIMVEQPLKCKGLPGVNAVWCKGAWRKRCLV